MNLDLQWLYHLVTVLLHAVGIRMPLGSYLGNDGVKVDVWAAGVTLYQMVVGRIPFDADNLCDLYATISRADIDLPSSLVGSSRPVRRVFAFFLP